MSGRKSTFFYGVLIALASLVVGMVIASRLDLTPRSLAGTVSVPAANSAPLTGTIDATTFRTIAHNAGPAVVSIVIESTRPVRSFGDFFGLPDQVWRRPESRRTGSGRGEPSRAPAAASSSTPKAASSSRTITSSTAPSGLRSTSTR